MKKVFLFITFLFCISFSCSAGEKIKCRKESYFYENNGSVIAEEFYFIENFIIHPFNFSGREFIIFYKDEENSKESDFYSAFGEYYPAYLGNGIFSDAAYGVECEPPHAIDKKIEEVLYDKNDFYRIIANEFYSVYLSNKEADIESLSNTIFLSGIKSFSEDVLRILRNTIYAKYGYPFKAKDLNEIFSKTEWFKPKKYADEYFDDNFSDYDKCLLEYIKLLEK